MKKLLSVLLCLVLAVGLLPLCAAPAKADMMYGEWWFEIADEGAKTAAVSGYTGFDLDLTIPAVMDGYKIVAIDNLAFSGSSIESIRIPEGVTTIGEEAFKSCQSLHTVWLPSTLTTIENRAFSDCGMAVEEGWYSSIWMVYYNGCEIAFYDMEIGTGNDDLLNELTTIRYLAPTLEAEAMGGFNHVEWTAVDDAAQYRVYRRDNEKGTWSGWTQVARLNPKPEENEWNDTNVIPGKKYKYQVRAYVDDEWKAYSNAMTVTAISEWTYTVYKGEARIQGYQGAGGSVVIPAELDGYPVTSIGDSVFYDRPEITAVTFPSGLKEIGCSAFNNCSGLSSVTIPEGVWLIESGAFVWCTNLEDVAIPSTVTSIGSAAFQGTKLTSVTIPEGVEEIFAETFYGCDKLKYVYLPKSLTGVYDGAFQYCTSLTDVFYSGSEAQWAAISISSGNTCLTGATIHFGGAPALTVSAAPGKSVLSWTGVEGATQYRVYRRVYSNGKWSGWATAAKSVKTTSWSDTDVVPGGKYKYRVRAYAGGAWTDYSNAETVTVPLVPALTVTAAAGKNILNWSAVPGATQYRVYRRDNEKGSWSGWSVVCSKVVGTSWNDTKVTGGKQYKYQVRAYVSGAWTDYSNAVTVKAK